MNITADSLQIFLIVGLIFVVIFIDKIKEKLFKKEDEEIKPTEEIEKGYNDALRLLLESKDSVIFKEINEQRTAIEKFNTKTAAIDRSILGLDTQTKNLLNILNNDQDRGKWAEFKVKDLLDSKGFVEGVHYDYQPRTAEGKEPDFVFYLPDNKKINLDCKFPWDGYKKIITKSEELKNTDLTQDQIDMMEKEIKQYEKDFISTSIKIKIKETSSRDGYIDPENGTVDYVMMWIPVEQIFQLILNSSTTETIDGTRQELSTIEYAFRRNVILVGPVGLLVQLEIIRNSLNIFNIENSIKELQEANKNFIDKVGKFVIQIGDLKTKIKSLNSSFKALTGTKLKDLNDAYVELQKKNEKKPEDTLEKIIEEYDQLGN